MPRDERFGRVTVKRHLLLWMPRSKRDPALGTMDLRIAAMALAWDALLLSADLTDFQRVPGLKVENWLTGAHNRAIPSQSRIGSDAQPVGTSLTRRAGWVQLLCRRNLT